VKFDAHTEQINKHMRTKTLLLTAALVAAGVASSMAQSNVYSLNIVGYVNIPVAAGKSIMLNNPFDTGTGNNVTNVIVQPYMGGTNDVPDPAIDAGWNNTQLYAFKQGVGYIQETYASGFGWFPGANDPGDVNGNSTLTLPPGKGFWFVPTTNSTVTFTGSVVLGSTNSIPPGTSQIGSAYAGSTTLSQLGLNGNNNDTIYRWYSPAFPPPAGYAGAVYHFGGGVFYATGYGWYDNDAPTSTNAGGGGGSTNGPVLNVGEAFFYSNVGATVTWPQSFTVN
jgi:hypothetical protein